MLDVCLGTIYKFDLTGTVQFGDVPTEPLYDLFKDGRICSALLSGHLERRFNDLTYVDEKGYDYIHIHLNKIEKKQITNNGLKFAPSSMIGVGRKVDYSQVVKHIYDNDLTYLIADIISFPEVTVMFIKGSELLDKCSNKSCTFTKIKAQELFKCS